MPKIVFKLAAEPSAEFRNDFREIYEGQNWFANFKIVEGSNGDWFLESVVDFATTADLLDKKLI